MTSLFFASDNFQKLWAIDMTNGSAPISTGAEQVHTRVYLRAAAQQKEMKNSSPPQK
jgi:hypothetical protein